MRDAVDGSVVRSAVSQRRVPTIAWDVSLIGCQLPNTLHPWQCGLHLRCTLTWLRVFRICQYSLLECPRFGRIRRHRGWRTRKVLAVPPREFTILCVCFTTTPRDTGQVSRGSWGNTVRGHSSGHRALLGNQSTLHLVIPRQVWVVWLPRLGAGRRWASRARIPTRASA